MRKTFVPLLALSLLTVVGCSSGGNRGVDVIEDSDIHDVGDLTEIACDFVVKPLKSSEPIDGIGGIKFWGDKALARSNDNRKLLCFDNYNLSSVLDKLGRGPGEYIYLSDFSYDIRRDCCI